MNVKNFIKELEKYDENEIIKLHSVDGEPAIDACGMPDGNFTYIKAKSDMPEYVVKRYNAMNVGELIRRVKANANKEAIVRLHTPLGEPVLFVLHSSNKDGVWLESESDTDMAAEISERFQDAIDTGTDEFTVYSKMLDQGIDIEMVRRHLGDKDADHMKVFCRSHGLID